MAGKANRSKKRASGSGAQPRTVTRLLRAAASAVREERQVAQQPVTPRGIVAIAALGAVAALLGVAHVHANFTARDFEMETRRLEEITNRRRDEVVRLEAVLSSLGSDHNLREAATVSLRMVEPVPSEVGELFVEPARMQEFESAAKAAVAKLENERQDLAWLEKEGF